MKGRRLLIVAHPDDETLWAGGLVLRHPGDWTIVACSVPVADPLRAVKFHDAIERLGAKGWVVKQPDQFGQPLALDADLSGYDVVVTHGPEGDYGHPHHVQVHHHVRQRARCRTVWFGYDEGETLRLTPEEGRQKLRALQAYDHVLEYDGTPMPKWAALLQRYGRQWLEREFYVDG